MDARLRVFLTREQNKILLNLRTEEVSQKVKDRAEIIRLNAHGCNCRGGMGRCPTLGDAPRSLLPRSGTAQAQGKTYGGKLRLSTTFPLRTRSPMLGFKSDRCFPIFPLRI
ncbi:hypothetical protein [Nostoc sp.]